MMKPSLPTNRRPPTATPFRSHSTKGVAPRKRVAAFTLVELLVTMIIITLLIVIGFSGLNRASALSKGATCLSHLRLLYTAHAAFANDHNQTFPYSYIASGVDPKHPNGNYFSYINEANRFMPYATGGTARNWVNQATVSTGFQKPYLCPSQPRATQRVAGYSYGLNGYIALKSYNRPANWRNASQTFLLSDAFSTIIYANSVGVEYFDRRHGGHANMVFLDGHAEKFTKPIPSYAGRDTDPFWNPQVGP